MSFLDIHPFKICTIFEVRSWKKMTRLMDEFIKSKSKSRAPTREPRTIES